MGNISEVIAKTGVTPYRTVITNNRSTFIADEKNEHGGEGEGATPDELLAMSLASCTSITLKMYADRKNWNLGEIMVEVQMQRNESEILFIRKINCSIQQTTEINDRLMIVANKCPIHKVLSTMNKIESIIV